MKLLSRIRMFVDVVKAVKKLEQPGMEQSYAMFPIRRLGYWGFTPEACIWVGELGREVAKIFYRLDEEIQHGLTFPPKKGECPQRVRFWQEILRPDLEEKMYYAAMEKLFAWSIHCVKDRGEKVEESESGCVRMEIFA